MMDQTTVETSAMGPFWAEISGNDSRESRFLPWAFLIALFVWSCAPEFVRIDSPLGSRADDLELRTTLNKQAFSSQVFDEYIHQYREALCSKVSYQEIHSAFARDIPFARVVLVNASERRTKVPVDGLSVTIERGGERNANLLYKLGNENGPLTLDFMKGRVMSGEGYDPMPKLNYPGHYVWICPDDSIVLRDSLRIFDPLEVSSLPPGRYWLLVSYQNGWIRKGSNDYWTGRIESDTAWFEITD